MSVVQYPFIDIAVHPRIRGRLAAGQALVIFSPDMRRALWANGPGAALFGHDSIYDFLDDGASPANVSFRQAEAAARPLKSIGENRPFTIRVTNGFQRNAVQAVCELIAIGRDRAILFAAPANEAAMSVPKCAARMIEGFDDSDTHRAVLDENGAVLAASPRFASLELTPHTARMLVNMVASHGDGPVKRPVPTSFGYLPAAMGKVSDTPPMHLLFIVEADAAGDDAIAMEDRREIADSNEAVAAVAVSTPAQDILPEAPEPEQAPESDGYAAAIEALAEIAEVDEEPTEEDAFGPPGEATQTIDTTADVATLVAEPSMDEPRAEDTREPVIADASAESAEDGPAAPEMAEPSPENDVADVASSQSSSLEETHSEEAEGAPVSEELPVPEKAPEPVAQPVLEHEHEHENRIARAEPQPFVFMPDMRATRFVWKIDAEGLFSEVSSEFARVVGPHAADINGLAFSDLAGLFNFDQDGKIAELLSKRDTWSSKTILWPIEGTILKVPVDLAALPTYTRSREFDGFRGFGIVRVADVVEDPLAIGLTLVPTETVADLDAMAAHGPAETDTVRPEKLLETVPDTATGTDIIDSDDAQTDKVQPNETESASDEAAEMAADAGDETLSSPEPLAPSAEKPALRIVETPSRRYSDKVIQFEGRRFNQDGLTPGEQAAFREIARRLEPLTGRDEGDEDGVPTAISPPANENTQTEAFSQDDVSAVIADEDVTVAEDGVDDSMADSDAQSEEPETAEPDDAEPLTVLSDEESKDDDDQTDEPAEETFADVIPVRGRLGLTSDIVDQMPVALLIHTGETLLHGNPEFLRLSGYASLEELQELGGLDALLQRDELDSKTAEAGGMVVVRADDVLVPVSARLQSVRWEQSTALMLALMPVAATAAPRPQAAEMEADDVAPTIQAETEAEILHLKVEVDELRSILETATDGVVIIGSEGDIRSMNRAASGLFNYDNEETAGKPFVMLFAHESQKAIIDYLGGLSGHGVASVLNDGREVIGREAAGGFLPLFMTIGRLTSSNGYCAVIRDITQWKRTEEELRNAKRAAETANGHKSDFLAHVSHEIRTPLNAIIGFADMMATERFGPIGHPRYIEYANDIGRSGRHVLDIVNDLLDISKIEAGEMDLDFTAVGLNDTVSEAVSIIQPQANGQRVIIRTALSQAVPQVVADLRSVKQIVLNILSNAIRFTPSGGQIVVSTVLEANGSVILRIRDTGIGMTRPELEMAMKPFRQVTGAARKRGDGTGLGLPLTKAMVDANRASFAISSSPNEGTLVEITFPSPRVLAD